MPKSKPAVLQMASYDIVTTSPSQARIGAVRFGMSKRLDVEIESVIARLLPVRADVLEAEQHFARELDHVHLCHLESARNLTHYVSLRAHDLRQLQNDLGRLGLSSLGRLESHTLARSTRSSLFFTNLPASRGQDGRSRRRSAILNSARAF
jgi:hypothetical protein